jgi:hypothetical protein
MSLLCRSKVKALALAVSKEKRGGKFTRVSGDFFQRAEANLRVFIEAEVQRHPSVGVTIR